MYNDNFNKQFNTPFFRGEKESSWQFWKYPVYFVLASLLFVFACGVVFWNASKRTNTKPAGLYQIEVNTFGAATDYITTEYKIDSITKCVQFKDMMGLRRKVCDHYTITTYIE
jgi:hypothetical protein